MTEKGVEVQPKPPEKLSAPPLHLNQPVIMHCCWLFPKSSRASLYQFVYVRNPLRSGYPRATCRGWYPVPRGQVLDQRETRPGAPLSPTGGRERSSAGRGSVIFVVLLFHCLPVTWIVEDDSYRVLGCEPPCRLLPLFFNYSSLDREIEEHW